MAKLFIVLAAGLSAILADSVLSHQVPSLQLQSLCGKKSYSKLPGDFSFNSFYQLKLTKNLQPLSHYISEKEVEIIDHSSLHFIFRGIRKFVPALFSKYLSETRKTKRFEMEKFDKYLQMQWYGADNFRQLMTIFLSLNANLLSEYLVSAEELREDLKILRNIHNKTSAFQNELIDVFYQEPIAQIEDFTLDRKQEWTYLDSSSVGRISFSLYVPFYDSSLSMSDDQPCTCAGRLPKFYPQDSCGVQPEIKSLTKNQTTSEKVS